MAQFRRNRLAEEIKKELSSIIQNDLKDPRIGFTSIMSVDVSKDMSVAKIYVSHLGTKEECEASMAGLKSAAGFMRKQLAGRLATRIVPELVFLADDSIAYGMKISKLIDEQMKNINLGATDE